MAVLVDKLLYDFKAAVELCLDEKCIRQTQNFVCLAQLALLSLQRVDALLFSRDRSRTLAGIVLLLA